MKGSVRILGALGLGVVVITAAFFLRQENANGQAGQLAVVTPGDQKTTREADADGNGIEDWREELEKNVIEEISVSTSTFGLDQPYEEPKTFTDKFARSFFEGFMQGKMLNDSEEDRVGLVANAIAEIEKQTTQKLYELTDISLVHSSDTSIRFYANEVATLMTKESALTESETQIIERLLDEKKTEDVDALRTIEEEYAQLVKNIRTVPTPQEFAPAHLSLVNAIEAVRMDVEAMSQALTDPLYTLARIKRYDADIQGIYASLDAINTKLNESKVVFTQDDPAVFFLVFDYD